MSIFCFNLHQPVQNLNQLKGIIEVNSSQIPEALFACMDYQGNKLALRLCSDEDINSLNEICKNRPVTLLYSAKSIESCINFKGFFNKPIKSSSENDFIIVSVSDPQDGDLVPLGQMITKYWKIQVLGNKNLLTFRCVGGDYSGICGVVKQLDDGFELCAQVHASNVKGWSSSTWRAFSYGLPFGPTLWIEIDVE